MFFFIFKQGVTKREKPQSFLFYNNEGKKNDVIGIQTVKTHAGPNKGL